MNREICQKRPMSVYSQPWWPNQKLLARPSFCITAIHWPANEPTTMMIRLTNRKFTTSFWYFGSCPEIAGHRYRTGASQRVACHGGVSRGFQCGRDQTESGRGDG